jgi:hypothetical protein
MSRALETLPWASLTEQDLQKPRAALARVGTSGDTPEKDQQPIWQIVELLETEAALHEAAGNCGKAECLIGFRDGLVEFFAQIPRKR